MVGFCTYNVRGLNNKQSFIKDFIRSNNITLLALLETRVKENMASPIARGISHSVHWLFNYEHHSNGRIWIGWDPSIWNLSVSYKSAQMITCSVSSVLDNQHAFVISFVYAYNTYIERRSLWQDVVSLAASLPNQAWCCSGDFNITLDINEGTGGDCTWNAGMTEFRDCLTASGLVDLKSSGERLTWWNSSIDDPILRKLDRVLVNDVCLCKYSLSTANFLPRLLSDHSPSSVCLGTEWLKVGKLFQIYQHLIQHPNFLQVVQQAWTLDVRGNPWYVLTT